MMSRHDAQNPGPVTVASSRTPASGAAAARPGAADLGYRIPIPYRAVFEFLPAGVMVTDAGGYVQGSNVTAKRMLGAELERDRVRCCDLLGCRRPGTPLAEHCVTELIMAHDGPTPDIRVDIDTRGGSVGSVWVTGSTVGSGEAAVVLQLRPGAVGDRRRRTEPHWMGGPRLRIFTFGRTRVESAEGPLAGEWLGHRPGQLLKYLVCHRDRLVPIDELLEALWPGASRGGGTNVRQAIHTLRDRLEPRRSKGRASSFVAGRTGGYEIDRHNVWIDADDFEASARGGLSALADGDLETAEAALTRSTALYRGEFLADESYAEWAFAERDRLRDLAGQAMRGLASVLEEQGDLEAATEQLHRLAELDPLDLDAQREHLALLLRRARHADAARRFEIVRRRFQKSFGTDPGFTLADLAAEPR
jgi:DNA-binding SARP family transcriptional activator